MIKLGDLIAEDDEWGADRDYYNREYRRVAKILYPEMYPVRKRKPSQQLINTLKPCNCGANGWAWKRYAENKVGFCCKKCNESTGAYSTNAKARDVWNKLIDDKKIKKK
ncbi:MAG: hypothetical protein U9Q27_01505 [Patescibacteria group bacterium]|nr:hypothetical protein [Patescibacteria group bacterium]